MLATAGKLLFLIKKLRHCIILCILEDCNQDFMCTLLIFCVCVCFVSLTRAKVSWLILETSVCLQNSPLLLSISGKWLGSFCITLLNFNLYYYYFCYFRSCFCCWMSAGRGGQSVPCPGALGRAASVPAPQPPWPSWGQGCASRTIHLGRGAVVQGSAAILSSSYTVLHWIGSFSVSDVYSSPVLFGAYFCFTDPTCVASVFSSKCLVEEG